jgi:hypothetical protein
MLGIEINGIRRIEEVHHARHVPQRSFYDQVIVIRHQAISMDYHPEPPMRFSETLEKYEHVFVGKEYQLLLVASGKDVIKRAGILNSQLPCQGAASGESFNFANMDDLDRSIFSGEGGEGEEGVKPTFYCKR